MKRLDRQKLLMIVAFTAFGLLIGDKLLLTPLTNLWSDRSGQIEELEVLVTEGRQLRDREDALNSRWRGMRNAALPKIESNAIIEISDAFDRWIVESDVSLEGIRGDWQPGDEDDYEYQVYECRATVSGTLPELTRFIYELEIDPLALRVEDLTFTPRDENGNQLALTILFSGLMLTADN